MSSWFGKAYRIHRAERLLVSPGQYAKNRAKSKAMSALGIWGLWRGWWRA